MRLAHALLLGHEISTHSRDFWQQLVRSGKKRTYSPPAIALRGAAGERPPESGKIPAPRKLPPESGKMPAPRKLPPD